MKKGLLQMRNLVKCLIVCLFSLSGISLSSCFVIEVKTRLRTSEYKAKPRSICYVDMNRDFLIDEMLILDQFPVSFLLKKYIIQKYIE